MSLIFFIISFVVSTELMFYYILTAPFLTSDIIGVSPKMVPAVMVLAQVAEIFVMAVLLPKFLPKHGIRKTLFSRCSCVAGAIYHFCSRNNPAWLVIAFVDTAWFLLCFSFSPRRSYISTKFSPSNIRKFRSKSLITLVILGIGNYVGRYIRRLGAGPIFTIGGADKLGPGVFYCSLCFDHTGRTRLYGFFSRMKRAKTAPDSV